MLSFARSTGAGWGRRLAYGLALGFLVSPASAQLLTPPSSTDGSDGILWSLVALVVMGGFTWFIFRSGSRCSACGKRHALEPTWEKNDRGDEQWRCRHCGNISWKEDPFRDKK